MDTKTSPKPAAVERCTIIIPREPKKGFAGRMPVGETVIEIRKPAGSGLTGGKISDTTHTIQY